MISYVFLMILFTKAVVHQNRKLTVDIRPRGFEPRRWEVTATPRTVPNPHQILRHSINALPSGAPYKNNCMIKSFVTDQQSHQKMTNRLIRFWPNQSITLGRHIKCSDFLAITVSKNFIYKPIILKIIHLYLNI